MARFSGCLSRSSGVAGKIDRHALPGINLRKEKQRTSDPTKAAQTSPGGLHFSASHAIPGVSFTFTVLFPAPGVGHNPTKQQWRSCRTSSFTLLLVLRLIGSQIRKSFAPSTILPFHSGTTRAGSMRVLAGNLYRFCWDFLSN